MTWIVKKPRPHACCYLFRPILGVAGDVWQCDDCGQGWRWRRPEAGWLRISDRRLARIKRREAKRQGVV